MNNVLVVTNSCAGRKQAIKQKRKIQSLLLSKQVDFKFINIDEIQETNIESFDTIIVVGGDGSINRVLPYLVNTNKTLGIIPTGTANLLSARIRVNNIEQALKVIDKEKTAKIDVMTINDKLSILRCGFGFDSDIIGKTPQSIKNKFGYFSYFVAGIIFALRLKIKDYNIIIDNKEQSIKSSCIIITNASNMFKNFFSVAKNSKLNDGIFDIFILKTENPILLFFEIIKIMFNIKKDSSIAEYKKSNNLIIKNEYSVAHIDGEKTKFTEDINFKITKTAINIFCPNKK